MATADRFPMMVDGFSNAMEHPQFGYAGPMQTYPDVAASSHVKEPTDVMWDYTYDGPVVNSDLYGVNEYGVVYDDYYNGIFVVDETIDYDEDSDFNGVANLEGQI